MSTKGCKMSFATICITSQAHRTLNLLDIIGLPHYKYALH